MNFRSSASEAKISVVSLSHSLLQSPPLAPAALNSHLRSRFYVYDDADCPTLQTLALPAVGQRLYDAAGDDLPPIHLKMDQLAR